MKAEVRIIGLNDLERALDELSGPIVREEMVTAMSNSVMLVETSAVRNVNKSPPEHPQVQTGRLIDSIMSEWYWISDMLQGDAGSNVEYGPDLEYGHESHRRTVTYLGVSVTGSSGFVGPYPWLEPALEENIPTIQNEFDLAVDRIIRRASKIS